MPAPVGWSLPDLRQGLRLSFLPGPSSLISHLCLWTWFYGISMPLATASPAAHLPPTSAYHHMSTLLHQWGPPHCLGLPYFSTLTTLSNYEKYNFSSIVFLQEGNRKCYSFQKSFNLKCWTYFSNLKALKLCFNYLEGSLTWRTHSSHMPDKWDVILLIFSTTELITSLFIKRCRLFEEKWIP